MLLFIAWIAGGLTLTLWANRETAQRERLQAAQARAAQEGSTEAIVKVRPGDVETEITREALASLAAKENGNDS